MVKFEDGRQRATNYIQICHNIADSYPQGTPHGTQKDAIQNGMDAVKGKGPLKVHFELIKNAKGCFFTITDSNTTGLSGPVLDIDEYDSNLSEDANWARFESFAFTKSRSDAIGARGQGKFIFLNASNDYTMYYDTLRDDCVYRLGGTQAQAVGCPILPPSGEEPWEGKRGAIELMERCGLEPLSVPGTRIIIVDPIDDLLKELQNGQFIQAIQETWFRAIEKKRAIITVSDGANSTKVKLPQPYPLPSKDSKEHKGWILGKDFKESDIVLSGSEHFKVKRFHAVYLNTGKVPENMQGIAIIHFGMKITSLPPNLFPPQVRERVTGFIELDHALDQELRKGENQHPNHYDLKRRKRLPRAIIQYIENQLNAFGKSKLGIGVDPREIKKRRRNNAEEWAMRQLQKYAGDLDMFGAKGKGYRPPKNVEPPPLKIIGISINNFSYPDPEIAPRVNWGHKFIDLKVTAYNQSSESRKLYLSLSVLQGDSLALSIVDHKLIALEPGAAESFEPFEIEIDKEHFAEPGKYRLKATLLDETSGDRIDSVARYFWVEKDPPLRQPFQIEHKRGFPEPYERRQWLTYGAINNSPTLWVNTMHPVYLDAEDDEEKQKDYMLQIILEGAMNFILDRPDQEDGSPDYHPLSAENILGGQSAIEKEEVPSKTYGEVFRYLSDVRWRMIEEE
ncbi:MAG: hypothetical protein BMS9Abin36_1676 [Gammaproteobacteria bacterium]|nr:MAG: hypothetical protein BMS9Abin36_1676 [Gammaproteobacteria bacterium]